MTAHVRRSGLSLAWHGFYLACMLPNLIVGGYDWARGDGFPRVVFVTWGCLSEESER